MAFQLKNFTSIVASMVNHARGATQHLTDFNVGSSSRTLLEASAIEIEELYQQMFHGLRDAIPVAVYSAFSFELLPAVLSSGDVTFTASPAPATPIVIAAGSIVKIANQEISFQTQYEIILTNASPTDSVRVVALVSGVSGNASANTITEISPSIATVAVTNQQPFTTGREIETEDERKARFADYIRNISRGLKGSIEYGARTAVVTDINGDVIEYVRYSKMYEPYLTDNSQPLGYVNCYIYNGVGSTTNSLVVSTQNIINGYVDNGEYISGWKGAGIVCTVIAVAEQAVNVTGVITAAEGFDAAELAPLVGNKIKLYIQAIEIGETCFIAEIYKSAMSIGGVKNFILSVPSVDTTANINEKLTPGVVTIT